MKLGELLRGKELRAFAKENGMVKETGYDYIVSGEGHISTIYDWKGKKYKLSYVSGCFYPMVFEVI